MSTCSIPTSDVSNVYAGKNNVYRCIALSNVPGTLGSNELAPFNTLKLPSLSKNILSTLTKNYSKSDLTSELNLIGCTTEAPVPSNDLSWLPELIVLASSTLGLKSKLSLNSYLAPVLFEV